MGDRNMPGEKFIQIERSGFRIDAEHLKNAFEKRI